ncbi:MAG: hypothetical protein ACREBN_00590, partial [Burkholderiaceae bacterium]
ALNDAAAHLESGAGLDSGSHLACEFGDGIRGGCLDRQSPDRADIRAGGSLLLARRQNSYEKQDCCCAEHGATAK